MIILLPTRPSFRRNSSSFTARRWSGCPIASWLRMTPGLSLSERRRAASCNCQRTGFVFCCFNQSYRISPAIFDVWMRLLRQVDGSVLWLRDYGAVASRNLRREAERRAVAPERLIFAARVPMAEDHLARQRQADLFLDTLNYNAHTTASDALWAGVPVLTCLGSTFAGRVAASQLRAVGLPELVTESLPDYEALALKIATGPALCLRSRIDSRAIEQLARYSTRGASRKISRPLTRRCGGAFGAARSRRASWSIRHRGGAAIGRIRPAVISPASSSATCRTP